MKGEPALDKAALVELIDREYGLRVERLDFITTSWTAYCYVAHCASGERYFLKYFGDPKAVFESPSDPAFYLPVTFQLHARGILTSIAHPIRALDGRLMLDVSSNRVILFNYIEGRIVGFDGISDDILARLAGPIGILHRSLPEIEIEHPHREQFALAFEPDLMRGLDALASIGPRHRRGERALRDLVMSHKGEILNRLHRLKELQGQVAALNKEMVICHTDLHGENLMLNDHGTLYILDWDSALIAPPEHDLFFFAGEERFWNIFLPAYEREFGRANLDTDVFGFYIYRHIFEDLAGLIGRILSYNADDAQDEACLRWVKECVSDLPDLETTIGKIAARLE